MAVVVGITGGVGTGKTTVLRMLGALGARTLSADDIAKEVLAKGTAAHDEAVCRFGGRILSADGGIDRVKLASIVFSDARARKNIESITHPRIIAAMRRAIDEFRADPPPTDGVFALEIPLLYECSLEELVDLVLVVAAEQQTQVNRLTSDGGASPEEALRRISAQMPLAEKTERADRVIRNDGALDVLERRVAALWEEIRLL